MRFMRLWRGAFVADLAVALVLLATNAEAESWPQRTVRIVVPVGAGSAPDVAARNYADQLAGRWKKPVVIENRPGADGFIGANAFVGMRDDHVLLFSPPAPISVFPFLQQKLPYDPARDFVPISAGMDTFGTIAASAALQVHSLQEFIVRARAQPGKLSWTGSGGAFPTLLAGFAKSAGLEIVHVSYREQNLAVQDLVAGRIQLLATTATALLPLVQAGKARFLAVTNKRRAPFLQQIPTVAESGHPMLEFEGGSGFFGGRGMADELRDKISADIRAIATNPALVERLASAGQIARGSTPAEFAAAIEDQQAKMAAIMALIGANQP